MVTLSDQASGTVVADAVKLVRDNAGDADAEGKAFTYGYDPNGNLTPISDASPGATVDSDAVDYDGLGVEGSGEARVDGEEDDPYTYDGNGGTAGAAPLLRLVLAPTDFVPGRGVGSAWTRRIPLTDRPNRVRIGTDQSCIATVSAA